LERYIRARTHAAISAGWVGASIGGSCLPFAPGDFPDPASVLLDRFSNRFVHCPQALLGPFMLRRGEELLRRSLLDDLPLRKETYAVCELAFAGLYCVNIGYGRTEVAAAIYEQAKKLAYYHTYVGHSTDTIIELSSRIIDRALAGMKKVYYGMSGSDANETQIKLVWYYNNVKGRPNKKKIISRRWARSTMACSRI
jgi:hypothetical protein